MNQYQPDENTKERYLNGELDADGCLQYELWILDHPEALRDVNEDLLLREAARQVYQEKQSQGIWRPMGFMALGAMAAALALMLINPQRAQIEANVPILVLSHDRGGQAGVELETLRLNKEKGQVVLVAQLPGQSSGLFSAALMTIDQAKTIFTVNDLKPVGLGDLQMSIPTSYLSTGQYLLKVRQGNQVIDQMSFQVVSE